VADNKRNTGRYELTAVGGEQVRAYVPDPLPPVPPLDFEGLNQVHANAVLALGRLDGVSRLLPDKGVFLYSYARKEAVLSSQIEGTQSSLSDLLLFEIDEAPGVPIHDVTEVSNYVMALDHGLARLKEGFPLSNRLIREIHEILLSRGRGSGKTPGEFRKSQNWIGGTRPGNARFVPPPHTSVQDCMAALERFVNATGDGVPPLIRAGLVHVQFETIHPFLDGNGRVGRLLITFLLCHAGVLADPLLYLSLYLKQNRSAYYDLLDHVRREGDWESWLRFFLEGVAVTADGAVSTADRLTTLFANDRERIKPLGRRALSMLQVHEALKMHPVTIARQVKNTTGLSFPAVSSSLKTLEELGVVRELTGRRRNRLFVYSGYLDILNEGTETPV
jgi:Fic family protein